MAHGARSSGDLRLARVGAVLLLVAPLALFAGRAALDPSVPFLTRAEGADWITPDAEVAGDLRQWRVERAPEARFRPPDAAPDAATARATVRPEGAALDLRAVGRWRVEVGGQTIAEGERRSARVPLPADADLSTLTVGVANLRGPPLFWLRSEGIDPPIATSPEWHVALGEAAEAKAIVADDTRPISLPIDVETPSQALRSTSPWLFALLALGCSGFFAARRGWFRDFEDSLAGLTLGWIGIAWVAFLLTKAAPLPLELGYDAAGHLRYLEWIVDKGALPTATDGWSTYHPPLFYLLARVLVPLGAFGLHLIPWAGGLANAFVAFALARSLFPGERRTALLAALFAAALPVNLAIAAFFSNEGLHSALVGAGLVLATTALLSERTSHRQSALVGAAFGLAALTKFTALAVWAVVLFFLALKLVRIERRSIAEALVPLAVAIGAFLAVCGWYYARNAMAYGSPVVGNWNLPGPGRIWWQQPGFHTAAYYLGFGEVFRQPWYAGFHSFGDGLWSTLWGDGMLAGQLIAEERPPIWNYPLMSASYLIAIPVAFACGTGVVSCLRLALLPGPASAPQRTVVALALTTIWALVFSIAWLTLQLPFYGQAKAFYGLCAIGPLALVFARGVSTIDDSLQARGLEWMRMGLAGVWTAGLGCFYLAALLW